MQNSCITKEHFRSENKYRCEQCCGYTEAIRSISFEVLPRLLIIQLKRFSGGMEKINSYIPTPLILNCFCVKCYSAPENEKPHIYRLYSVITHVGATMSVGHYIAYTCSLEVFKAYVNCPKDKNKKELQNSREKTKVDQSGSSSSGSEKNSSRMKKTIFGRNKASSSGDMTKNLKNNFNGVMNKIVNGNSDKIIPLTNTQTSIATATAPPTPCPGLNCCGIQAESISLRNSTTNMINGEMTATSNDNDLGNSDKSLDKVDSYSSNHRYDGRIISTRSGSGESSSRKYGGSGGGFDSTNRFEPTWFMCDDDKIKAMTQDEFENLLSPNNKVTITPYLLFYARVNNEK